MATRTIQTSQPVLFCDLCERSLLRGEQHDVFLQAGERRTVCELCTPRATQEGWLRERDIGLDAVAGRRERPARGILQRLRRGARAPAGPAEEAPALRASALSDITGGEPLEASTEEIPAQIWPPASAPAAQSAPDPIQEQPVLDAPLLEQALLAFNASEFPRRVRGLARSLGEPSVNVRVAEHLDSAVRFVVAWELCWYRYEIDLSEAEPAVRQLAQGTELSELERDERTPNAMLASDGALSGAPVA
jgi:hypothetical protein